MPFLEQYIKEHCQQKLNHPVTDIQPVSGGDINQAFKVQTSGQSFFVKYQKSPQAMEMFRTEAKALRILANAGVIRIPEVVHWGSLEQNDAMLLLEYIAPGQTSAGQMRAFGHQLAQLHRISQSDYGWEEDNFIGTLPQKNRLHTTAASFLESERLRPQWEMARKQGFFSTREERAFANLLDTLPEMIPEEQPALIHGDLWGGNYLIDQSGNAVLIDPASSYGLREMDIAMSRLFGNFGPAFYEGYEEEWPLPPGYEEREEIHQLYYLLVHVNLFGQSYISPVQRILKTV